jgi:2-polyprenyl-3-methyl-5-hydroxy-6-metoxy-1,4-benzoquinol methylase
MDARDRDIQGKVSPEWIYRNYVTTHTHELTEPDLNSVDYAILRFLPSSRDARILDLGCGSGLFLLRLASLGYTSTEGIDISEEQVNLARLRGLKSIRIGDAIEYLNNSPGKFDVITANDFLEHLDHEIVLQLLEIIARSLKPGGLFLAQTPNGASPLFGGYFYGDFTHQTAFSPTSVQQICHLVGFQSVEVAAVPPRIRGAFSFCRRVLWVISTFPIKVALAAETGRLRGHIVTSNLVFRASTTLESRHGY